MKNKILISTSLVTTLLFSGCGIKINEYNVSADNVQTLRNYKDLNRDFTSMFPPISQISFQMFH